MVYDHFRQWLLGGCVLAVVLLPLMFNPFAVEPFEPAKVTLLWAIVGGMLLFTVGFFSVRWAGQSRFGPGIPLSVNAGGRQAGKWLMVAVLLYACVYIVATLVSIDVTASLWGQGNRHGILLLLSLVFLFFILTITLSHWSHVEMLITSMIIGSVPVAFYGWMQFLGLDTLSWQSSSVSPVHSTLGRSVFLGAYLAMVIPYVVGRVLIYWRRKLWLLVITHLFILVLLTGCLVFTLARGAWLGLIGGVLLFAGLLLPPGRGTVFGLMMLMMAGLSIFFFVKEQGAIIFAESVKDMSSAQLRGWRAGSDMARLVTWNEALALIPERWAFGYGPETFAQAAKRISPDRETLGWFHMGDPHNLLLYHLTAVGFLGLLTFLWIVAGFYSALLACIWRTPDINQKITMSAIVGSTTAYLVQAQFNPDMVTTMLFFWLNLSFAFVIAHKLNPLDDRLMVAVTDELSHN